MTKSKSNARKLLNQLVRSYKLQLDFIDMGTKYDFDNIQVLSPKAEVHMRNLIAWCELLEIPCIREDWEGNEQCNSNWDIVYFIHEGVKFYQLVHKEVN